MSVIDFRDQNRKLALSVSSEIWNNIPRSIFLADLEENSEPPSWFKDSPWNAPAFRLPSAFARHAQLQGQRTPLPAAASGMRMMAASGDAAKAEFEAAMQAIGLEIPRGGVIADGKIHRCNTTDGKNGKNDGAYCLHLDDGIPAGWFQNHKDGAGVRRWHARTGQKLTEAEVAAHKAKVRAQQAQREAELEKEHVRTAARATALVENNPDADDSHLYFVRKKSRRRAVSSIRRHRSRSRHGGIPQRMSLSLRPAISTAPFGTCRSSTLTVAKTFSRIAARLAASSSSVRQAPPSPQPDSIRMGSI